MTIPWSLPLLGQIDGAQGTAAGTISAAQVQSIWDFVVKGGPMMIPIGICSLVVVTVIIERLISLRRGNVVPDGFLPDLRTVLDEEPEDRTAAIEYCKQNATPVASVLAVGVRRLHEPVELLEKHIQEAGQREVFKLRKYLRLLFVIASIAPLLGLLGTIFGMITAFQTVATSGEALGKAELLAKGIYEAMITTAAGLIVAIPALIGHNWISAKIEHLVAEIDRMTCEFLEQYARTESTQFDAEPKLIRPAYPSRDREGADHTNSSDSDRQTSPEPKPAIASA